MSFNIHNVQDALGIGRSGGKPGLLKFLLRGRNIGEGEADNTAEKKELLVCIDMARNEWINAVDNFRYAVEWDIIDYYIYEIKACQARYEFLIKKAKKLGVRAVIPRISIGIPCANSINIDSR